MLKIAICDDNTTYLEITKNIVKEYCDKHNIICFIECFDDSTLLAEYVEDKKVYDAYILDIEMPNVSGLELSEYIRRVSESSYIVFLTAFETYAISGYGINVLSYVLKARVKEELTLVLDKLFGRLKKINNEKNYLICNQRKYIKLRQSDIIYIYKKQKNVVFVLKEYREEWERITLHEVYKKLDNPDMFFLDRSTIINVEHIRSIYEDQVEMLENNKIFSSKGHIWDLKQCIG